MFAAWPGVTFAPSALRSHGLRVLRLLAKNSASSAAIDSASSAAVGRYDVARRIWAAAHEGVSKEQTWAWCREGLIESARRAADQGVMLALQNHPPVVDNGDDMLRMVHEVGSPSLQACFDAPLARRQGVVDVRAALLDVGSRQVLSHFGGESDRGADGQVRGYVREPDGSLTPESFYAEFARGLAEIGYDGYIGYELCHPLPVVDGRTVGIEFADRNARLAAEYMRAVLNDARTLAGHRAATGR